jgi:hypothetical protein
MFNLPKSTEVNRRVPKDKLYIHGKMPNSVREAIKNQIEAIIWRNKLTPETINVAAGSMVEELHIFEIVLRQRSLDKRVLPAIAKAIPYKVLFVLRYENESQAALEVSGAFYNTDWDLKNEMCLVFDGLNMDKLYENLARQISGGRLDNAEDIAAAVERDKHRQRLEREIALLEKRLQRGKQLNRQMEINRELRELRAEMEVYNV